MTAASHLLACRRSTLGLAAATMVPLTQLAGSYLLINVPHSYSGRQRAEMHWTEALMKDPVGAVLLDNLRSPRFIISPGEFLRADISPRMTWHSVKFDSREQAKLPTDPGLYAFVVRVDFPGLPPNGWVLYIGQTGDGASAGTLRGRFGQYLRDKKKPKRPAVFFMLNAWDGALEFFYTPLSGRKSELEKLETELLGAFRPPFTDRTYPATYMSPRHAF